MYTVAARRKDIVDRGTDVDRDTYRITALRFTGALTFMVNIRCDARDRFTIATIGGNLLHIVSDVKSAWSAALEELYEQITMVCDWEL
ncbi:hypothetical protein [Longimycelium tulufanense]|nr:hypothetical protein [Longimycelium tulufanense]